MTSTQLLRTATAIVISCRHSSSQRWLKRQENDPYVKLAREKGLRARSAFKLIELNRRFKLLKPGMVVVECGAAPGAWTQVAAPIVTQNPRGIVVGCDLLDIEPVEGATLFPFSDFTVEETQKKIAEAMGGRRAGLVMSDMAPNASGVGELDADAIGRLATSALRFALVHSQRGASFLAKVHQGRAKGLLEHKLQIFYNDVKSVKPKSSRKESAEIYLLATGFRGATLQNK